MRLPWIQVAMEVLEVSAPELGARLDISDAEAFYALVRLMAWARARCPEDKPPSASDSVRGPTGSRQISAAAQFNGDPDAFVECCCTLAFPVLERVDGGVRVRGLDRYDAAWAKNNPAKAAAWKLAHPEPAGNRPETEREPSEYSSVPPRQIQTQTHTQKKEEASTPAHEPAELARLWNDTTSPPLPKVDKPDELGKARKRALTEALKRRPLNEWKRVFERINASSYCRGSKGWTAGIDWATRAEGREPEPATKVLEGNFDDHRARAGPDPNDGIMRSGDNACAVCGSTDSAGAGNILACYGAHLAAALAEAARLSPGAPWTADLTAWAAEQRQQGAAA